MSRNQHRPDRSAADSRICLPVMSRLADAALPFTRHWREASIISRGVEAILLAALRSLSLPHGIVAPSTGAVRWEGGSLPLRRTVTSALMEPCHPLSVLVRRCASDSRQVPLRLPGGEVVTGVPINGRILLVAHESSPPPSHWSTAVEHSRLTPREREVAECLMDGLTAKEISTCLGISLHTARRHTESVFAKLGVNRRGAVVRVLRSGVNDAVMEVPTLQASAGKLRT